MGTALLLARIILSAVFGLAAIAKFLDLKGSRAAILAFGLPEWLAGPVGFSLPALELVVAALLLPVATVWWGACGALTLLFLFVLAISINMAQGRRPECHCFGQLHSEPVGAFTLARNGALSLLATLVLSQARHNPGLSISSVLVETMKNHTGVALLGLGGVLLLAFQTCLVLQLFRQNGRLLLRIEALETKSGDSDGSILQGQAGLQVGMPAPEFELAMPGGGRQSLASMRARGKPVLLLFSDPQCGPCKALFPDLTRLARDHVEKLTVALISRGDAEVNERYVKEHGLRDVFIQRDREVAELYQAFGTPSAVVVHPDGRIGSRVVSGAQQIGGLIASITGSAMFLVPPAAQPGPTSNQPAIGKPAPSFALPDASGNQIRLEDFKGHATLLLLWNPLCGFCHRMLPRLKEWEHERRSGAPQLLVVSTGTAEQNRNMGISSSLVLDHDQSALRLFGAGGTPSALLIDAEGKFASRLAMGADAIFELIGYKTTEKPGATVGKPSEAREAGY